MADDRDRTADQALLPVDDDRIGIRVVDAMAAGERAVATCAAPKDRFAR